MLVEDLQAMGFSILAALPNLIIDGGAALHLSGDASVDCGAPELVHSNLSGEALMFENCTTGGASKFDMSPRLRSEARYSFTIIGTITLSIQLLISGLMPTA